MQPNIPVCYDYYLWLLGRKYELFQILLCFRAHIFLLKDSQSENNDDLCAHCLIISHCAAGHYSVNTNSSHKQHKLPAFLNQVEVTKKKAITKVLSSSVLLNFSAKSSALLKLVCLKFDFVLDWLVVHKFYWRFDYKLVLWLDLFQLESRSTGNFSFQFIASYVCYSMESLAGDLLLGLKFV